MTENEEKEWGMNRLFEPVAAGIVLTLIMDVIIVWIIKTINDPNLNILIGNIGVVVITAGLAPYFASMYSTFRFGESSIYKLERNIKVWLIGFVALLPIFLLIISALTAFVAYVKNVDVIPYIIATAIFAVLTIISFAYGRRYFKQHQRIQN